MSFETAYMDLISGHRRGALATAGRLGLASLAQAYGVVVGVRNWWHSAIRFPQWLDVPVISVGNVTVGGTGKTPMTIWLCQRLLQQGHKPAVLSRGYRADEEGMADELLLVSRHCPDAVTVANPDRYAAGQLACEEYGSTVAILDDGFQHRRLGRDLDIVLIDATCPFGYDAVLPRGLLREPVFNLARADAIVLTRCNQVEPAAIEQIRARVTQQRADLPILEAIHSPVGFRDLDGRHIDVPQSARIGCFAGIARPGAFQATLAEMGYVPADCQWWSDHHVYNEHDIEYLKQWALQIHADMLLTTEKDAVKLMSLDTREVPPIAVLRVEMAFAGQDEEKLLELMQQMMSEFEQSRQAPEAMSDEHQSASGIDSDGHPDAQDEESR